jgi:hypothetical protein
MQRSARSILACLLVLAASARARPALAQATGGDEEALIKHGLELREKGDDEAALREFRRAHDLSHSGRALAQVALAEQALGHWADAESHLSEAMRHEREPWVARNMRLLRQALADIQSHLGSIELSGGAPGAEVSINGARAGTLPLPAPLRVPAGSVALEVRAPEHLPMLRTVIVPAGGLAREPVVLVPIPSPSDQASASPQPPPVHVDVPPPPDAGLTGGAAAAPSSGGWSTRRKVGAALAAGGVPSLAVGIVFNLIRNSRASSFNSAGCTYGNGNVGGPAGVDCSSRYDDIQTARNVAIGGYAGAALLAGTGAILWFTGD